MGYVKDIAAALRWLNRAENAVLRKERELVRDHMTPAGAKRYRRWRNLFILAWINKRVTGYW